MNPSTTIKLELHATTYLEITSHLSNKKKTKSITSQRHPTKPNQQKNTQ